jgi:hypothetical protein
MKEKSQETVSRRGFLGAAGKSVAAGVGAMVTATGVAEGAEDSRQGEGCYRVTPHVKAYYETARF